MNRIVSISRKDERIETRIEALLSVDSTPSIVDSLLSLPDEEELKESGSFGRAIRDRLQAKLADKMRREIGSGKDDRSAA